MCCNKESLNSRQSTTNQIKKKTVCKANARRRCDGIRLKELRLLLFKNYILGNCLPLSSTIAMAIICIYSASFSFALAHKGGAHILLLFKIQIDIN